MMLTREGQFSWTVVDDDWLAPHNLARHTLGVSAVGCYKAAELAKTLSTLTGASVEHIDANVMHLDDHLASFTSAASRSIGILDASASIPVARRLADMELGPVRRLSVFFNPRGNSAVLLAEDRVREVHLDAIEGQYYRHLLRTPTLAGHLAEPPQGFRYAGACRSVSARIPESRVATLSGLVAQSIPTATTRDIASGLIWSLADDGTVQVSSFTPCRAVRQKSGGWTVILDDDLTRDKSAPGPRPFRERREEC